MWAVGSGGDQGTLSIMHPVGVGDLLPLESGPAVAVQISQEKPDIFV